MRGIPQLPDSYFDKYKDKKVRIIPFDPQVGQIAKEYIELLRKILVDFDLEIVHRGSTAMGIAGKGEVELGIYPNGNNWDSIVQLLANHYGKVGNIEENYARFNDVYQGTEVEIILMKGYEAQVDKKLTAYLISNKQLLKEYEEMKYKYCDSKRDYMIQKDKFFRKVIEMIPED